MNAFHARIDASFFILDLEFFKELKLSEYFKIISFYIF